jgi:P27 family predicted phage terminase small subunit
LQVEPKIPKAPKLGNGRNILGREGMREWRRITTLLANAKVVAEIDRTVLTQYCKLWEMFCADSCVTGNQGDMFNGTSEPKEFTAAMHTQMRLCAVELGLTPSARSRLRG